jgi:hypothetical protein
MYGTVLYRTVLRCAALKCKALYCTIKSRPVYGAVPYPTLPCPVEKIDHVFSHSLSPPFCSLLSSFLSSLVPIFLSPPLSSISPRSSVDQSTHGGIGTHSPLPSPIPRFDVSSYRSPSVRIFFPVCFALTSHTVTISSLSSLSSFLISFSPLQPSPSLSPSVPFP